MYSDHRLRYVILLLDQIVIPVHHTVIHYTVKNITEHVILLKIIHHTLIIQYYEFLGASFIMMKIYYHYVMTIKLAAQVNY